MSQGNMNPEKSPDPDRWAGDAAPCRGIASTAKEAGRDLGQSIENKRIPVCRNRATCLPRSLVTIDHVVVDVDQRRGDILMGVGSPSGDVMDDDDSSDASALSALLSPSYR